MTAESNAPKVLVMGDMRDLHHHGCEAVIAELQAGLERAGLSVWRMLAGIDWHDAEEDCLHADLVVINGEGALHHGRPNVRGVIELAERRGSRPTALLNTSWFDNPPELSARLRAFRMLCTRESLSAREIAAHGSRPEVFPDLAVLHALRSGLVHRPRNGFMTTDSTKPGLTRRLRALAGARGWDYCPVLAFPNFPRPGAKSRKIRMRTMLARMAGPLARWLVSPRYHAHAIGDAETRDYLLRLAESAGVVTGRFHVVCFALAMRVPFVAVASNTPKIEALLKDAGLDPSKRVMNPDGIAGVSNVPPFDSGEIEALDAYASRVENGAEDFFRRIATLVLRQSDAL